ncbi:MAG: aldehyde dehydrogenase (NADP(+)) [Loktanella sp.]|nr:aldehyde dehydrogenase (NADP(+)) [Loktanella sp.]
MGWIPTGKHLIAGNWVEGDVAFSSSPARGPAHRFTEATTQMVEQACAAAETASWDYGALPRARRAEFLRAIADEIEARGADITEIGTQETGLPTARLEGERGRTTGQLRLFASHIEKDEFLDIRHDAALPDRTPLPRPDLRLIQRPIGAVAVFGASNFPLAFSVLGGDTASALAAGCPVVVRGHPAHPGTGEIMAQALDTARVKLGIPSGVFSLLQGADRTVGAALVQHPDIRAVGFTGSLGGGRSLFDLCAQRNEPIPFFGELGSVNPMFLLPAAMVTRGTAIAQGWAASLTMGAGQFCTNPGIAFIRADQAATFAEETAIALGEIPAQVMLSDGIAAAYRNGVALVFSAAGVQTKVMGQADGRNATSPGLFIVSANDFLKTPSLSHEVFGPLGIVVTVNDDDQMVALARSLTGQLTATLQMDKEDTNLALRLVPVLERKAGRVLANGFPTGVEVSDAMVHGGPYPASTNFGATSVGTLSIRRWMRPVCYQDLPHEVLPNDLTRQSVES